MCVYPGTRDLGGHLTILPRELGYRVVLLGGGGGVIPGQEAGPSPATRPGSMVCAGNQQVVVEMKPEKACEVPDASNQAR